MHRQLISRGSRGLAPGRPGCPATGHSVPDGYLLRARFLRLDYDDADNACPEGQHVHPEHVVLWPEHGSLSVRVDGVARSIEHGYGLWVPAGTPHAIGPERDRVVALHIAPEAVPGRGERVMTVAMVAAARELLAHMAEVNMPRDERVQAQRVCLALIADEPGPAAPLPIAYDPRVAEICRHLLADPADARSLEQWAWQLSVSSRTLARAFKESTGKTYGSWRTGARVECAMRLLDQGTPVSEVARKVGYSTTSAFSTAFARETGRSPSEYHPSLA
ncbi:helix-turn-helix domain-containing protein [Leucobacter chinensis]|uniref:helix-turn-helix domain-containing protein n=1 Tax=Leucobacter chinensis TaxID=2851010 RepID=UPI001C23FA57|nr:AraC family transcriptional regulator [Leucobacter chinensis]